MVFTGPQCPWCRAFEPVVRSVTRRCGTSALRWADLSTDAGAAEAREHGVQGIPTSLLLGPGGEVLGRLDGYVPEEDLLAFLRASGEGACAED